MVKRGIKDPLFSTIENRITLSSDFETPFLRLFCLCLAETFHPTENKETISKLYAEFIGFGCDVHAHRIVQEKIDRNKNRRLYNWAIGTRKASTCEQVEKALQEMVSLADNWKTFTSWSQNNIYAKILWFVDFYKTIHWSASKSNFSNLAFKAKKFLDTNANESINAKIKSQAELLMGKSKGMLLLPLINMLERMGKADAENIVHTSSLTDYSVPQWKRSTKKRKRVNKDDVICLDGCKVTASQPKRARCRGNYT